MRIDQALAVGGLPAIEVRALLRHLLKVEDVHLIAHGDAVLSAEHEAAFRNLVARRAAGEPIAYITGRREFYGIEFRVTPAVLIPRPETELLVECALDELRPDHEARVLDLGTGSGCVAIAIARERPRAQVTAVDASVDALAVARENARLLAVPNIEFLKSDWFAAVMGRYDLIVANPPYVAAGDPHLDQGDLRFEPQCALSAGRDGFDAISTIVAGAAFHLERSGLLALEHGHDQAERCREILKDAGLEMVCSRRDLSGIERISAARVRA
jgi:release factor glutamine methyltransferase